jgi:outer membrane protein assembly factor BamB
MIAMRNWSVSATVFCLALSTAFLSADEVKKPSVKWPSWRGPHFNGVADGENFPTKWSATDNVKWKITLPGKGASTPIVVDDCLYLTHGEDGKNHVSCFALADGKLIWTTKVGSERAGKHQKATGANPSIVTDGQHAYAYFKSGDLACLDLAGKIVWQTNLQEKYGKDTLWWDLGTSPVLTSNGVVIAVMHTGPSFIAAFEKATGNEIWKTDRNLEAPEEAAQSYSTPMLVKDGDKEVLVTVGADHVTAHDAADGKEIWRYGTLNPTGGRFWRSISSVVVSGGVVIAPYARGNSLTAIKLGGAGDVTSTHKLWHHDHEGSGADVPTPIADGGKVYVYHDARGGGSLECLDLKTGKQEWTVPTPRHRASVSASPIKAGNTFYVAREDGTVFVIADGKIVSENPLDGDMFVATPVLVDGKILLRTVNSLYCIE